MAVPTKLNLLTFLVLLISYLGFTAAAPAENSPARRDPTLLDLLSRAVEGSASPKAIDDELETRSATSAGLAWGPAYVADKKLYMTNIHLGYAGPKFPRANHVNIHVDRKAPRNSWKSLINLHVTGYKSAGRYCMYIWDSQGKGVIFDECSANPTLVAARAVAKVREVVAALLVVLAFFAFLIAFLVSLPFQLATA